MMKQKVEDYRGGYVEWQDMGGSEHIFDELGAHVAQIHKESLKRPRSFLPERREGSVLPPRLWRSWLTEKPAKDVVDSLPEETQDQTEEEEDCLFWFEAEAKAQFPSRLDPPPEHRKLPPHGRQHVIDAERGKHRLDQLWWAVGEVYFRGENYQDVLSTHSVQNPHSVFPWAQPSELVVEARDAESPCSPTTTKGEGKRKMKITSKGKGRGKRLEGGTTYRNTRLASEDELKSPKELSEELKTLLEVHKSLDDALGPVLTDLRAQMGEAWDKRARLAEDKARDAELLDRWKPVAEKLHQKHLKRQARHLAEEEADCYVCLQGRESSCNKIMFCERCCVAVHEDCYGSKAMPGEWFCDFCSDHIKQVKPYVEKQEALRASGREKKRTCSCCGKGWGGLIPCSRCKDHFHPTCGEDSCGVLQMGHPLRLWEWKGSCPKHTAGRWNPELCLGGLDAEIKSLRKVALKREKAAVNSKDRSEWHTCHCCKIKKGWSVDCSYCEGHWCSVCVARHRGDPDEVKTKSNSEVGWECYNCMGTCTCAACRKKHRARDIVLGGKTVSINLSPDGGDASADEVGPPGTSKGATTKAHKVPRYTGAGTANWPKTRGNQAMGPSGALNPVKKRKVDWDSSRKIKAGGERSNGGKMGSWRPAANADRGGSIRKIKGGGERSNSGKMGQPRPPLNIAPRGSANKVKAGWERSSSGKMGQPRPPSNAGQPSVRGASLNGAHVGKTHPIPNPRSTTGYSAPRDQNPQFRPQDVPGWRGRPGGSLASNKRARPSCVDDRGVLDKALREEEGLKSPGPARKKMKLKRAPSGERVKAAPPLHKAGAGPAVAKSGVPEAQGGRNGVSLPPHHQHQPHHHHHLHHYFSRGPSPHRSPSSSKVPRSKSLGSLTKPVKKRENPGSGVARSEREREVGHRDAQFVSSRRTS